MEKRKDKKGKGKKSWSQKEGRKADGWEKEEGRKEIRKEGRKEGRWEKIRKGRRVGVRRKESRQMDRRKRKERRKEGRKEVHEDSQLSMQKQIKIVSLEERSEQASPPSTSALLFQACHLNKGAQKERGVGGGGGGEKGKHTKRRKGCDARVRCGVVATGSTKEQEKKGEAKETPEGIKK
ncbi:hypothetical protein E2320_022134 [Naja naja]|nr:hypothetical protein E2320_022134 [Naja naja]